MSSTEKLCFDFDTWIEQNNLSQIKDILIKHNLNLKHNLSTQTTQFAAFISDPILFQTNSHLISNVVSAIQHLSVSETKGTNNTCMTSKYVVVSETEENILESLQSNMDTLHENKLYTKELSKNYEQSVHDLKQRKLKQINNVNTKINEFCDELHKLITCKQTKLLKDIQIYDKTHMIQNSDDQKGMSTNSAICESTQLITETQKQLNDALTQCQKIIESSVNMNRNERIQRKKQLININNYAIQQYIEMNQILKHNFDTIDSVIQTNNCMLFDIAFDSNKCIMDNIRDLQLTNEQNDNDMEGYESKMNKTLINYQNKICELERTTRQQAEAINLFQSTISVQMCEIDELKRKLIKCEQTISDYVVQKNRKLQQEMNAYDTLDDLDQKNESVCFPLFSNSKRQRHLSQARSNDISFLVDYARKNSMDKPEFKYEQIASVWKVRMSFGGVDICCESPTKRGARINCLVQFVETYI